MKRRRPNRLIALTIGLLLVLMTSGASFAAQGGQQGQAASGSYIVVFRSDVADAMGMARDLTNRHGVTPTFVYRHALKGFAFKGPDAAAQAMARNPNVAYVEPDGVLYALGQTIPTGVKRMDAHLNATAKIDGIDGNDGSAERVNVDVAVLDTGVAFHNDLNVVFQVDCTNESDGPPWSRTATCVEGTGHDGHGHGTHVAGSIAALDNGFGVVGVAPGARIWGIKVLEDNGSGSFAMITAGVDYVAGKASQIKVANMSLGGQGESQALETAIANAVGLGVTFVVAAGNSGADVYGDGDYSTKGDNYVPASYPEVMTVSALADSDGAKGGTGGATSYGADDTLATFSNFSTSVSGDNPVTSEGKAIDVAAPGVNIFSTYNDGSYATMSGTSMASPHAAGRVALHIAANGLNPGTAADVANIRQAIIDSGQFQSEWNDDTTNPGNDPDGNYERMAYAGDGSGGGGGTDPTNTPPTGGDQSVSTNEDTAVTITLTGSDAEDCSLLTFSIVSGPANGTVGTPSSTTCDTGTNTASATVSYTPNANYNGSDSFTFRVTDSAGAYDDAVVSITVNAVNDAPVAGDDSATTTKNQAVTVNVLANDSDVDGDSLTVSIVSGPGTGTVTLNGDNTVTYTPNADYVGTDSFVYQISDGEFTDQATVSITIQEASTGWNSGDLESSVWSDSGNPNGKYSSKDYSFTPALGAAPTQMTVSVNVSSGEVAATLSAYIKVKGSSYWVCDVAVSGTGTVTCSGTLSPGLVVDGTSNTLRLAIGPLTKGESFAIDVVEVNLQ